MWRGWGGGGRNHWWITHEPRTYHLQSLTNHWNIAHVDAYEQIRCSIPRTFDARPTHESLTKRVQTRTFRERSTYKHFRSAINVIRARFMRDMKVGRQWTDVDVRGFEPVLTHKHWRPTRVPRIVKHTRDINYARRLKNSAHRRTKLDFFNRSKLKITHKPPSTHIHSQSLTITFDPPTN